MSVHDRAAATARRGIAKHGRPMVLLKPGPAGGSSFDPQPGEPIEIPVIALQLRVEQSDIGGPVLAHDRKYMVDGEHEIVADMQLRDKGATYDVRVPEPLEPGVTRIFTEIFAGL